VSCPSSPTGVGGADPNRLQVRAIPCEDGGFVVEPSSSSPIRTFTRLQDLDQKERSRYQNQFKKASSSRKSLQAGVPSASHGEFVTLFVECYATIAKGTATHKN